MATDQSEESQSAWRSRAALHRHFCSLPPAVQAHFAHFGELIASKLPLEVCLAYAFYRVEIAHRNMLYAGIVRLYHTAPDVARSAVRNQHLTRDRFRALLKAVVGKPLPSSIAGRLEKAEAIRDRAMHGSEPAEAQIREALYDILEYARGFDQFVVCEAGFAPFHSPGGARDSTKRLDKATTRLVLLGLGFVLR